MITLVLSLFAIASLASIGVVSVGFAKGIIDRIPKLRDLGWGGALAWPGMLALAMGWGCMRAGYKMAQAIPANELVMLPGGTDEDKPLALSA